MTVKPERVNNILSDNLILLLLIILLRKITITIVILFCVGVTTSVQLINICVARDFTKIPRRLYNRHPNSDQLFEYRANNIIGPMWESNQRCAAQYHFFYPFHLYLNEYTTLAVIIMLFLYFPTFKRSITPLETYLRRTI